MNEILNSFEDLLENPQVEQTEEPTVEEPLVEEPIVEEPEEPQGQEGSESTDYSDNSIYTFLQQRGVKDPGKVQLENEDGTIEEVDFYSLSIEDQLDILNQVTDPGLSEDEINTINYLRRNGNVTLEQVVDYFAQQRLEEYLNEHPEAVHKKAYTVDDYSDDDLYLIDLKNRYPDFTDEELMSKLDEAKTNEDLYKKETTVLRNTYKAQEDQAAAEREQLEKQQVEDLRNNLINAASKFNEIQLDYTDDASDSLVIEETDKPKMISYILDQDSDGKSQLVKDLENPDTLIELAWFRTHGAEALSNLSKYWKGLLTQERNTNKKLQAQIDKLSKRGSSTVVVPHDPTEKKRANEGSVWDNSGLI